VSAPADRWVDLGRVAELKCNPGHPVKIDNHWVAVFRHAGGYRAIDNNCPHASAPLCDGTVMGGKVVCYLHCWEFDLETGHCDVGPRWNVRTYPLREVDGRLELLWPGPAKV
jgi:nitrite reductase/ring-hydroxylating ferredoxin subunit